MDTSEQRTIETVTHIKRRRRSVEEKRRIVEETLGVGSAGGAATCDQRQPSSCLAQEVS
jgi:hypothetical protein